MYIRLEYSESAGHFHFSPLNDKVENRNGYITLSSKIKSYQAEQFCEQLRQKFPEVNNIQKRLTFAQVKHEFLDYINQELKTIREAMTDTYQQRSRIFRKQ